MASVRSQLLSDYRNFPLSEKRKVLTGTLGSSASSIARQSANSEMSNMIASYNDGVVSNADFLTYLQKAITNKYFTPSEKVTINNQIRDFQARIDVEKLSAIYDSAADGSPKIKAAQDLANYYDSYASTLQVDTPAYSQAIQNKAKWSGQAATLQDQADKQQRQLDRATKLTEISKMSDGTVEKLQAKTDAYIQLAQQAYDDGQQVEGMKYEEAANNYANAIPKLQEQLANKDLTDQKNQLRSDYADIANKYHDGDISAPTAASMMNQLNTKAVQLDDATLLSQINSFADMLQKDIEAGVNIGEINGLKYKSRITGGNTTISQQKADFAKEDDQFRQALQQVEQIPDAVERTIKKAVLYAKYIYGSADGAIGLKNRETLMQEWIQMVPGSQAAYENSIRDNQSKIITEEQKFQQVLYQAESIPKDILDNQTLDGIPLSTYIKELIGVAPDLSNPNNFGSQMVILVGTDKNGRPYEQWVPINSDVATTDASGNIIQQSTYVGKNIAPAPDGSPNKYVKLQGGYLPGNDPAYGMPDFLYGEYQGKLYVKPMGSDQLVPASEISQTDNPEIAQWYQTKQADEAQRIADYQAMIQPIGPVGPPQNWEQVKQAKEQFKQNLANNPQAETFNMTPTGEKIPAEIPSAPIAAPTIKPDVGVGNFQLPSYNFNNFSLPQTTSSYEVSPSTQQYQLPSYNINAPVLSNVGEQPSALPNVQKNVGQLNIDQSLGMPQADLNSLPPVQSPTQQQPSLLSKIGTGISNAVNTVANFFKKLKPFG